MMNNKSVCELCGEPMPEGEEMFKFHGYSSDCPKPPLQKPHTDNIQDHLFLDCDYHDGVRWFVCLERVCKSEDEARNLLKKWESKGEQLESQLTAMRERAEKAEEQLEEVTTTGKLIDAWIAENGKQIPWEKAIRIVASVMKMPDAERDRLLCLDYPDFPKLVEEYKQRAEAAEQRILASQNQEPSVEAYAYVSKDMCKVTVTNLRFIGDVKSAPYGTKFYKQPPIPPELSEVVRERDELRRKLAEQQSQNNFDAARLRRLVSFCGVAAPDSDEELLQVAGVVIGSCLRNLTKLLEEAKRQAVPEDSVLVKKNFITYGDCLRFGINIDDIRSAAPQPEIKD